MASEHMSQDEIDALLHNISSGEVNINVQALGSDDINEASRVRTAMERLQFAQENGMSAEEIRYRSWYLKDAAHALWLKHHRLTRQEWQDKVQKYFMLHPEYYQLLLLKRSSMHKY